MQDTVSSLFDFIAASPSAYQTVDTVRRRLIAAGYHELSEGAAWHLLDGEGYFVLRNGSSLLAFRHQAAAHGFAIVAAHGDSPSYRVKMHAESAGTYLRLETEPYGGMIHASWLDRPLSVAGRAVLRTAGGIETRLVDLDEDLLVIPSVAIHMNRSINDSYALNPAVDMLPLYGMAEDVGGFSSRLAEALGCASEEILSHDLFLYNREHGRRVGHGGAFLLAPRLDDLACVYAALEGFLTAAPSSEIPILAVFDNEEVGSETKQGAASTFLADTLTRIADARLPEMLYQSFMVSADNAHAKHPNHPELADADHAPVLGQGIVIKYNANQRYTTDAYSDAFFRRVCETAGVPTQRYCNRADLRGGSTLGSIADTKVSVPTVDIGLPQLAMHAATETAAAADLSAMVRALAAFYSASFVRSGDLTSIS